MLRYTKSEKILGYTVLVHRSRVKGKVRKLAQIPLVTAPIIYSW